MDTTSQNQNSRRLDSPSLSTLPSASIAGGTKRGYPEYQTGPRKTLVRLPMEPEIGPRGTERVLDEHSASPKDIASEHPHASQVETDAPNNGKEEGYDAVSPDISADEVLHRKWLIAVYAQDLSCRPRSLFLPSLAPQILGLYLPIENRLRQYSPPM